MSLVVDTQHPTAVHHRLHKSAQAARERAYAPYSGYAVGAALLTATGDVIAAANVENASYGLTICAERAALFRALAEGHKTFSSIAIAADSPTAAPCGACRQVLAEFDGGLEVAFPLNGELVVMPLSDLLPHGFGRNDVLPGS